MCSLTKLMGTTTQIVGLGLPQLLERLLGVGLQPFDRSHSTLIREGVGVGMAHVVRQGFHDQIGAGFDLLLIGVAGFFHIALGDAVGTEEDMGLFRVIAVAHLFGDQLGHRLDVAGVVKPTADAADRKLLEGCIALTQPLQFPEAGAAGADGEVGIERQSTTTSSMPSAFMSATADSVNGCQYRIAT